MRIILACMLIATLAACKTTGTNYTLEQWQAMPDEQVCKLVKTYPKDIPAVRHNMDRELFCHPAEVKCIAAGIEPYEHKEEFLECLQIANEQLRVEEIERAEARRRAAIAMQNIQATTAANRPRQTFCNANGPFMNCSSY